MFGIMSLGSGTDSDLYAVSPRPLRSARPTITSRAAEDHCLYC